MAELKTVPRLIFNQGDLFVGDSSVERPIRVAYYNGTIQLEQDGDYDQPKVIAISVDYFEKLVKEIRKHLPEATRFLKERFK